MIGKRFDEVLEKQLREIREKCTACGMCAERCPIYPYSPVKDVPAAEIQKMVLDCITEGKVSDEAYERCYSCMGCLLCTDECPQGLVPAWVHEQGRAKLRQQGKEPPAALSFLMPHNRFSYMRVMEAIQIDTGKTPWYRDVPDDPPHKDILFFTGCGTPTQPDQIFTLNDIATRMGIDYAILAGGSDLCCGDVYFRAGDHQRARDALVKLIGAINAFSPKLVVFFCSNCRFRLTQFIPRMVDWDYQFITQFLADNLGRLGTLSPLNQTVTMHDACRLVRGEEAESDSPRRVLEAIPGVELVEMEHCRELSNCCGGPVIATSPKTAAKFLEFRLGEAEDSGAQMLVSYCTGCMSGFVREEEKYPYRIRHLISILGESMGIFHDNVLGRFLKYHDAKRVMEEARQNIDASIFTVEEMEKFLGRFFR